MVEKLDKKLEEEIEKIIKNEDLSIKDIKDLADIKNSLALGNSIYNGFGLCSNESNNKESKCE